MEDFAGMPGTPVFNGVRAARGYALNKICFDFDSPANRAVFLNDEEVRMRRYGLDKASRAAIRRRNMRELLEVGGNVHDLAKFAGIFGLTVQDIGAQKAGTTKDAFRKYLAEQET